MNKTEKENILIVDDRPEDLLALEKLLKRPDLNIIRATSGNDALAMVLEHDFALILLDVQMPVMDGFETAELLRENNETKRIPIIFITAISKEQKHVFKGYDAGAVDYLFKPLDPDILKSKVNVFLELHKQKTSLEEMNEELRKANKKMWEQQKAVIEEERLKVLLQMAGATAYEFNQPLKSLLENIKLIETGDKERSEHITRIQEAGEMISGIVEKIMNIHHYEVEPRSSESYITDPDQKTRILLVDDSDDAFEIIRETLRDINFTDLSRAVNIEEALAVLKQDKFDLILLDHVLGGKETGFDFLESIAKEGIEIPVIVVTGYGNEMLVSQIIQAGAYDYLPKNKLSTESLSRAINNTIEKARLKVEAKKAQARMAEMSTIDELTKLANRRYFMEALEGELERARRYKTEMMLVIMDLDHFKKINDTYGHLAGDMVLSEIGRELKKHIRYNDLACRYGGEEFAVILPNTNQDRTCIAYERFRKMVEELLFKYESNQFHIRVSIGVASSNDSNSPNDLIAHADHALYQAKETGRNKVVIYTPEEKKT
jgi:two-component system cell cycle response regulator